MLDEIGARPAITYLRDVTHQQLVETGHGEEHAEDTAAEHAEETGQGSGEGEEH